MFKLFMIEIDFVRYIIIIIHNVLICGHKNAKVLIRNTIKYV